MDSCKRVLGIECSEFEKAGYLKANNTGEGDQFGVAVSLHGDTLAVGARREDGISNATENSGAVYIFTRDTEGVWKFTQYLQADNVSAGDEFGFSVSLWGDYLAVGAYGEDGSAESAQGSYDDLVESAGSVHVFRRTDEGWVHDAYLKASHPNAYDQFGRNISLHDRTLIVGAHGEDSDAEEVNGDETSNAASNSGAAYVFTRDTFGTWSQQAYLKPPHPARGDWFGYAVSAFGDRVAVGAIREDGSQGGANGEHDDELSNSGAVYVFVRHGANWSYEAYLKASAPAENDSFGAALSLWGDRLAVGVEFEDGLPTGTQEDDLVDSGAVHVFQRTDDAGWAEEAHLEASHAGAKDRFGKAVFLRDDILAVGAILEDSSATAAGGDESDQSSANSGAVYLFRRREAVWSQQAYVKAADPRPGDQFGYSVSLQADVGYLSSEAKRPDMLAIGVLVEDSAAIEVDGKDANVQALDSGAVYVRPIAP